MEGQGRIRRGYEVVPHFSLPIKISSQKFVSLGCNYVSYAVVIVQEYIIFLNFHTLYRFLGRPSLVLLSYTC